MRRQVNNEHHTCYFHISVHNLWIYFYRILSIKQ